MANAYGTPAYHFQRLPGSRTLILGGLLEVRLPSSFAIEADILHRPLRTTIIFTKFPAGGPSVTTTNNYLAANTCEFPLMLKWNLPSTLARGRVRPVLEGGVAFRTSSVYRFRGSRRSQRSLCGIWSILLIGTALVMSTGSCRTCGEGSDRARSCGWRTVAAQPTEEHVAGVFEENPSGWSRAG